MTEFFINLFDNRPVEGKKPHFKALFKLNGVDYECALWPAKEGKKGFSGKAKPKQAREPQKANGYQPQPLDDEIVF